MDNKNIAVVYIRVVAMLMVVYYHCLCFYTLRWGYNMCNIEFYEQAVELLNRIDIPAFVFISGYVFSLNYFRGKYDSTLGFLYKKGLRLLIPYFFWGTVVIIVTPRLVTSEDSFLSGFSHVWFLLMLFSIFVCIILTRCIWERLKPWQSITLLFAIILPGHILSYKGIAAPDNYLQYKGVLGMLPFFYLGLITCQHQFNIRVLKPKWAPLALLALLCTISGVYVIIVLTPFYLNYVKNLFIQLSSIVILFLVFTLLSHAPLKNSKLLDLLDRNSMSIYIIHHIYITVLLQWTTTPDFMQHHIIIAPLLLFFSSIVISIIVANILRRIPLINMTL